MEKVKLCGKVVGVNDGNIFVDGVPLSAKNQRKDRITKQKRQKIS